MCKLGVELNWSSSRVPASNSRPWVQSPVPGIEWILPWIWCTLSFFTMFCIAYNLLIAYVYYWVPARRWTAQR
jgi:hypothetical protein